MIFQEWHTTYQISPQIYYIGIGGANPQEGVVGREDSSEFGGI